MAACQAAPSLGDMPSRRSLGGPRASALWLTCALMLAALAMPVGAAASWSGVMRVPLSTEAMWPAAAVNGRGDVAVAWIQEARSSGHATVRVRAAIRVASSARFEVRTLVARRDLAARGTAVALDAHGELTVAWIEQPSDNGRLHRHKTVRAAYRLPGGRWSRARAIGRSSAFNYASPRLVAARGGTVALTYNGRVRGERRVVAAWRMPGRPFGSLQSVPTGRQYLIDPSLVVDPDGRMFLTGTRGCDQPGGRVLVAIAPPGRRRFTTSTAVSTTPGKSVRMAAMGPDAVALSWLSGTCNTTEDTGGGPYAATVRAGRAGEPVALATDAALTVVASPAPGGADVSFTVWPATSAHGRLMTARINADGTVAAPADADGGWIALAGDAAGDQLFGHPDPAGGATTPLAARAATSGASEPAPLAAVGFPWTGGTLAADHGRALAAISFQPLSSMTPSIVIAVWRP